MRASLLSLGPGGGLAFRILVRWLPLAIVTTAVCLLVAGAVQQDLRQGADDPQIQMVEDAAAALADGQSPDAVLPAKPVDVAQSLAPFVIVFDPQGHPRSSSGRLAGEVPALPSGVFAGAREHGEDRLTWQPAPGVRIASVVVPVAGGSAGFVLAGRSLREVEKREDQLNSEVVLVWLAALGGSLVAVAAPIGWEEFERRNRRP